MLHEFATAALLVAPLAAQSVSTVVASDPLRDPGLDVTRPLAVHAHPAGGVMTAFEAGVAGAPAVIVRRLAEDGERLWTASVPLDTPADSFSFAALTVTEDGSTVLALEGVSIDGQTRLVSLDPSGSLRWDVPLPSTVTGARFGVEALGSAPGGDVLVAGLMDAFSIPPFAGRATVRRLDGSTGAAIWTHESPAISRSRAAFRGDSTFLVFLGAGGVTVESVDGAGTVLYSTTVPLPFSNPTVLNFVEVGPAGELAFGAWEAYTSLDTWVHVLDPAGNIAWSRLQPATWPVEDAAFTPSGELMVMEGGALGIVLRRYGVTGTPLWTYIGTFNTVNFGQVESLDGGDAVLLAYHDPNAYPYRDAKLVFVGAGGALVGEERFLAAGVVRGHATMALDRRGNLWVGATRYEGGFDPAGGETLKVVPGGDPSGVLCTQATPNSTGVAGRLRAAGSGVAAADNLTLVADRLPAGQSVMFLASRTAGFLANPGGSLGDLCLGGSIGRYARPGQLRRTSPVGLASLQLDLPATPSGPGTVAVLAGETWHFQAWHRDVVGGAAVSHMTGAVTVGFL